MSAEQDELMEKLNSLEFETSQLAHAYQRWRSQVEQGTAPEWMVAAIRVTYDTLIRFSATLALEGGHAEEIERNALNGEIAPLGRPLLTEDNSAQYLQDVQLDANDAETDGRVPPLVDRPRVLTPGRPQNRIVGMLALADVPNGYSRPVTQLEADAYEISGILEEESTTLEASSELLAMESDWPESEMPVDAISELTIQEQLEQLAIQRVQQEQLEQLAIQRVQQEQAEQYAIQHYQQDPAEQYAIQRFQHEQEAGAEGIAIYSVATLHLPNWLHVSSTGKLFGAASVAILMVAGGAIGIYLASPQRAAPIMPVQNSAVQSTVGGVALATGERAEFKFQPDPLVAPLGSSFVLNAVLARGSDIASVAVEVDYDASLMQFMGVSQGGFLANAGRHIVLAQRNDPLTGVLKINAEQSPGNPGISGDGPVFALSFRAKKRGKGTVSIVPSAHDSQGQRIDMAGSQASVRVN